MPFVNERTGKKAKDELVVYTGEDADPDGIGVLVTPDGEVTNRWGDGTAGISDELRGLAGEEVDAYDPYTKELYVWRHPKRKKARHSRTSPSGIVHTLL